MNVNADGSIRRGPPGRPASIVAATTGHSAMRPSSVVHAGRSRVARTSSASRACQAVPARQWRVSSRRRASSPACVSGSCSGRPASTSSSRLTVATQTSSCSTVHPTWKTVIEIVLEEHVVGHRRGVAPPRRPALEPQGAGGEHGVRCLLRRERARRRWCTRRRGRWRAPPVLPAAPRAASPRGASRHEPGLAQQIDHGRRFA